MHSNGLNWEKGYGVGEILLTSIDNEGMQRGFEMELTERLSKKLSIPFIVCGGLGKMEDAQKFLRKPNVMQYLLHLYCTIKN